MQALGWCCLFISYPLRAGPQTPRSPSLRPWRPREEGQRTEPETRAGQEAQRRLREKGHDVCSSGRRCRGCRWRRLCPWARPPPAPTERALSGSSRGPWARLWPPDTSLPPPASCSAAPPFPRSPELSKLHLFPGEGSWWGVLPASRPHPSAVIAPNLPPSPAGPWKPEAAC